MAFRTVILCSLLALAWPAASQDASKLSGAFDPSPWLDDFHQLLSEMSSHYANLEWAVEARHMDLPELRRKTEARLREAKSENDARRIMKEFTDGFGDGHLEIRWPKPQGQNPPSNNPSANVCGRLGYKSHLSQGLDFSALPVFTALRNENSKLFPAGLLRLPSGKVVGTLRISLFSETEYPDACEQAIRNLRIPASSDCDQTCSDRIQMETGNILTAAIVGQENALRQAGATSLLVDITHNGGGSNWVGAVARALSPVPLRDPRLAFIRHQHWTKHLQERLDAIQKDGSKGTAPKQLLDEGAETLRKAIRESALPCNRADVWDTGKLDCSLLVKDLLYSSGVLPYAKPGSFSSLESKTVLFNPLRYTYTEDQNRLPLTVVVDSETWSAAEYFAAILKDNHAATILGELTGGAGCGYTNGGVPAKLKNSGAEIKMSDCVRLRADGTNEVSGITPDVVVPWADRDSQYQRLEKLESALEQKNTSH